MIDKYSVLGLNLYKDISPNDLINNNRKLEGKRVTEDTSKMIYGTQVTSR
jgi:hypothetical protein